MITVLASLIVVTAVAIFLSGLLAFIRNRKSAQNVWFFVFASLLALWTICNYIDSSASGYFSINTLKWVIELDFSLALLLLWSFLNFSTVLFSKRALFSNKLIMYSRLSFLVINVVLIGLIFSGLIFDVLVTEGKVNVRLKPLSVLYLVVVAGYFLESVGSMLYKRRHVTSKHKGAIHVIILGLFIAFVANILTNILFPQVIKESSVVTGLNSIGYVGLFIFVLCIFVAITRQRLFDIRLVVARSLAYIVSLSILATGYGLVVFVLTSVVLDVKIAIGAQIIVAFATAVIGLSFQSIRSRFDKATTHIFYQDSYLPQDLFNTLNNALVTTIDLSKMLTSVSKILENSMYIEQVSIHIYDAGLKNHRIFSVGNKLGDANLLNTVTTLKPRSQTVFLSDDFEDGTKVQEAFSSSSVSAVARIGSKMSEGRQFGLIVLGVKKSGNPYGEQDIRVLEGVANELAIAVQNALHYEEIQQFNETLQGKVESATRELRATNDKLKKLDETKDEFISMASHQLRTPLTSVKGYLSMVIDGDVGRLNKQQRELLTQSYLSSQRMVGLISDLLNLSRLSTGKFVIDYGPVDLRDVVEQELLQIRDTAAAREVDLIYEAPKSFPVVRLDNTKIHQVVMNFIDNAIYYTSAGGRVEVQLLDTPSAIEFRVIDNGIGVPRELQRHLFTKFYRADNARRVRPDGTGLGLFMAKKVILAQGGSIIFESEEGRGSTFGFRFSKEVLADKNRNHPVELQA